MVDRWLTLNRVRAVLVLLLVLVVASVGVRGCGPVDGPAGSPGSEGASSAETAETAETARVTIDGRVFELELALTPAARYQGLSDRESIASDGGMLFVFPDEAARTFVMRRCLVPIDLIYLDAEGRVLNMHQMEVEPYHRPEWMLTRYRSDGPAQYVVEVAGGTLDELGVSPGDRIDVPAGLKRRAE